MPTIRITDFPMVYEIRNEYIKYRQDGFSRAEATEKLKISYHRELADAEDDAPMFWIGLAEGQCHYHELTESVSREASSALEKLKQRVPDLSPVDIRNRQELYARAPMPEKAKVPKSRKFVNGE